MTTRTSLHATSARDGFATTGAVQKVYGLQKLGESKSENSNESSTNTNGNTSTNGGIAEALVACNEPNCEQVANKYPLGILQQLAKSMGISVESYLSSILFSFSSATTIAINGPKPLYTGPNNWANQVEAGGKFANRLGWVGMGITLNSMRINGINTSNSLDLYFGGVSFGAVPGAIIGGTYFMGNIATEATTGKTIGQHVDRHFYILPSSMLNLPFILIPKK